MIRWKSLLAGAVAFTAVHLVLIATWQTWFHGGDAPPWFMNSTLSVAFAAAAFLVLSAVATIAAGGQRFEDSMVDAANLAAGAVVPMVVVLFTIRGGPGNLFPIAIAIGMVVLGVSCAVGALVGWPVAKVARTASGR